MIIFKSLLDLNENSEKGLYIFFFIIVSKNEVMIIYTSSDDI